MKAKCMILLLLACAWVLWRDMGDDVGGWWPASEHETLTQCQTAWLQAVDNMVEATAAKEVERRSKMGFIDHVDITIYRCTNHNKQHTLDLFWNGWWKFVSILRRKGNTYPS